ncbi:uncharacterized protein LOC113466498 isoform X3 [Diaphorina citri]|uniref:Uncharacterized protein LOC113466498 isoform X3 n=1 Tax=Diaphorina citri TaxID=121845 RepID=A0A3Q0INF4_DIACI|nr:uncharacterized protein LOC113466498 isoform X3 [Diaphorina citri]XP_026677768.1 uncharacterized protein LOC113466498 isoform X3 [Diaphorina citri]
MSLYNLKTARRQESTIGKLFHNKHPLIENLHQNNNNHLPIKSHNAGDTMGDHGDNHATETATEATIVENSMEKPKENHTAPAEPKSDKPEGRQGKQILFSCVCGLCHNMSNFPS